MNSTPASFRARVRRCLRFHFHFHSRCHYRFRVGSDWELALVSELAVLVLELAELESVLESGSEWESGWEPVLELEWVSASGSGRDSVPELVSAREIRLWLGSDRRYDGWQQLRPLRQLLSQG